MKRPRREDLCCRSFYDLNNNPMLQNAVFRVVESGTSGRRRVGCPGPPGVNMIHEYKVKGTLSCEIKIGIFSIKFYTNITICLDCYVLSILYKKDLLNI